ncbi:hypothetical protein ACLKA7_005233 [Drosophila subpalustris]
MGEQVSPRSLGCEGLVEDLRNRLCAFIQTNNHTPETWARLAALEAQRPKTLEPPVEGDEPCCWGRVQRVSESDLGNARIREASQHRAGGMDAHGTMAVPATPVLPRPDSKVSPRRGRWLNRRYPGDRWECHAFHNRYGSDTQLHEGKAQTAWWEETCEEGAVVQPSAGIPYTNGRDI